MRASIDAVAKPQEKSGLPPSLSHILDQCKIVIAMLEESARPDAESRLTEAIQALSVVCRALASEITERVLLNHEFAAIQEQEESARHRVLHDALTSLPNRILFNDRLEHALAQSLRHDRSLAVMFIDFDGFKDINDQYGHDAGDSVLQTIATRLSKRTRSEDTVCRHGGDEFLYLLAEAGSEQSTTYIAERIIRTIQEPCSISWQDTEINVSVHASIGIALSPRDGITVDGLVKSADAAMYLAKQEKSGHSFVR